MIPNTKFKYSFIEFTRKELTDMTKTKNIKIPSSNSRWNRWHVVKQRLYLINVLDTQCTIPVLPIVFLNISLNHAVLVNIKQYIQSVFAWESC